MWVTGLSVPMVTADPFTPVVFSVLNAQRFPVTMETWDLEYE